MGVSVSELKEFSTILIQTIHFHNATRARVRRTIRIIIRDVKKKMEQLDHLLELIHKQELEVDPGLVNQTEDLLEEDHDFLAVLEKIDEALVNMPFIEEAEDVKAIKKANEDAYEALKNAHSEAVKERRKAAAEKMKEAKKAEREAERTA
ncbi:hypothetical protein GF371_00670 [Candidatus Woesearchaeota archaeon]|nr:hypothetical protein [Candidatus Woesearchaeota archaeon]